MGRPIVFIWWDEYNRRDLPCVCMACGNTKAAWGSWTFSKFIYKNGRNYRQLRKTQAPLCKKHAGGTLRLAYISASDYDDNGVWTMNVHEDFVDALKKHRKAEVKAWKAEHGDSDPDDFDEEMLPAGLRTEPEPPKRSNTGFFLGMGFFAVVMGIVLVGFLAVCVIFALIFGLAMRR